MKIYKFKKDWKCAISNGGIGFGVRYKKGDRLFKPTGPNFFPENGGYPISERDDFKFVDEYLELVGETDMPKEYYLNKKYSQSEVDEMLKKYKGSMGYLPGSMH